MIDVLLHRDPVTHHKCITHIIIIQKLNLSQNNIYFYSLFFHRTLQLILIYLFIIFYYFPDWMNFVD